MKIPAFAFAALLLSPTLLAQAPRTGVAQLKEVQGNVLVSRESGLGAGSEALRLGAGTRVITTNKSGVIVVYDDGCEVTLKANERFQVEDGKPCAALVAQPQSILATPEGATAVASAGSAAAYAATLPALGGALAGLAAMRGRQESQPVSPN